MVWSEIKRSNYILFSQKTSETRWFSGNLRGFWLIRLHSLTIRSKIRSGSLDSLVLMRISG